MQTASEPVELPHDQRVPRPQGLQARRQPGAIVLLARRTVLVEPAPIDPGREQSVALGVGGLSPVSLRHPHVPDEHPPAPVTYTAEYVTTHIPGDSPDAAVT